ncbi:MAG: transcription repressor NadR [Ruminococcus sp.]
MSGSERRQELFLQIRDSEKPISATKLSQQYGVSRQVIVQDIALLRASGYDIISTNRGYIINKSAKVFRIFKVKHTDEQLRQELNAIVDLGGTVDNVIVHHRVYGKLEAELNIDSRRKVTEFWDNIQSGKSSPLKNITSDYHYHRVSADSKATLDIIESTLKSLGFLVEQERKD